MSRVLRRIQALYFHPAATFRKDSIDRDTARAFPSSPNFRLKTERSMVAGVPDRRPPRRNGQHHDTERQHHQSHELEYKRIKHGNSPA
jgi:hypothetical protein